MRDEIWKNSIKCFREMRSPFDTDELCKLDVTLTECGELSTGIAEAMDFLSYVSRQQPVIFVALITAQVTPGIDIYELINHMKGMKDIKELQEKIRNLKTGDKK